MTDIHGPPTAQEHLRISVRRDMADREHVDAVQVDPMRRRNAVWYSVAIAAVIVGAISIWRGLK